LDSAIDDLSALMEMKAQQPRGDDPTTANQKTALQIEQLKQNTAAQKNAADNQLKVIELKLRDQHEKMKIASNEKMKMAELMQKRGDEQAKMQQSNLQAMHDQESHQADMAKRNADMQMMMRKQQMAEAAQQAKQADMAARAGERQAAQQFRQQHQPVGPGGV